MAESKILVVLEFDDNNAEQKLKAQNSVLQSTVKGWKDTVSAIKSGGVSFSQVGKEVANISKALKSMIPNLEQLDDSMRATVEAMIEGLSEGVVDALNEARGATDDLTDSTTKTGKATNQLRAEWKKADTELKNLIKSGDTSSAQYKTLVARVAELKDTIDDTNAQIRLLGESGLGFRALSEGIGLMSGAFGVATASQALFGEESEALNETMTRLNAITALNTSLEQINNALKAEGALATSLLALETKLLNAQRVIENALTSQSVVVRGLATAAQWALNAAMAANPIGLVVVALGALVAVLTTFSISAAEAKAANDAFNDSLENSNALAEEELKDIGRREALRKSELKSSGASERDAIVESIKADQARFEAISKNLSELSALRNAAAVDETLKTKDKNALLAKLDADILKKQSELEDKKNEIFIGANELRTQDAADAAKQREADAKAAEEAEKKRIDALIKKYDDLIAAQQLIALQNPDTQKAIDAQAKIIELTAKKTLDTTKLTENQRAVIIEQSEQDISDMKKTFLDKNKQDALQAELDLAQARAADPALDLEGRFAAETAVRKANYDLQRAQLEAQNKSTAAIDEKFRNEQQAARGQFNQAMFKQSEENVAAEEALRIDSLNRVASNEKNSVDTRIAAIQQISDAKDKSLEREQAFNEAQFLIGAQSQEEFLQRDKELTNEREKNQRETEEKITETVEEEEKKRLEARKAAALQVLDFAAQGLQLISQMQQQQSERELQAIDFRRERLEGLRESGSITEKEYLRNLKKIDAEEKRIQTEAAKREKNMAIYSAIINTAAAVVKALPDIPLSIIVGALGLAQIALIAAKPLPKFRGGTHHSPEGLALVGEGGPELIQSGGRMYLTPPKPSVVWLKGGSQVLTAQTTRGIMQNMPRVTRSAMEQGAALTMGSGMNMDELGKSIGKNLSQVNINIDKEGFFISQQKGLALYNYLNDRYKL